jgi:hypothetical protein
VGWDISICCNPCVPNDAQKSNGSSSGYSVLILKTAAMTRERKTGRQKEEIQTLSSCDKRIYYLWSNLVKKKKNPMKSINLQDPTSIFKKDRRQQNMLKGTIGMQPANTV